ncbi:alpha/beta fold hydrolase [Gemmatimonas sp.]|jgi:pimeloyl-ACP methyl ester carboxylesterase|uniref:alpha/beta fold hydrolase n=1 Tax=Gemmatimonas sp. TaxID=1962908 RepID=UPI00391DC08D
MIGSGVLLMAWSACATIPHLRSGVGTMLRPPEDRVAERDSAVQVAPGERLSVRLNGMPALRGAASRVPTHIVLLPGPVGSAFSMRHVSAALCAHGLPVLVIDPLGMGRSSRPTDADYSLAAQARRIAAVLDSVGVARTLVVAHGTSATLALRLAAAAPERISGILSLAGGPIDRQETTGVRLALALAPLLDTPVGRAIGRRRFLAAIREQSAAPAWCTPDVAARYLAPIESDVRGTLRVLRAMQQAVEPSRIETELHRIRAPVRLLVGDHPTAHAPTAAQVALLQRQLARLRVDTITGAGTMLHEERADAVVAAVLEMLNNTR